MKNLNKFLAATLVMACLSSASYAQGSDAASNNATALIVAPISIETTSPMDFGWLATTGPASSATLNVDGTVTPGTNIAVVPGGLSTAAAYTVEGEGTNTYAIVLPTTVNMPPSLVGAAPMSLDNFLSSIGLDGTLTDGTQDFTVGARLNIGLGQSAGEYVSAAFDVTVSYN